MLSSMGRTDRVAVPSLHGAPTTPRLRHKACIGSVRSVLFHRCLNESKALLSPMFPATFVAECKVRSSLTLKKTFD